MTIAPPVRAAKTITAAALTRGTVKPTFRDEPELLLKPVAVAVELLIDEVVGIVVGDTVVPNADVEFEVEVLWI
jgi:hypothetical protein